MAAPNNGKSLPLVPLHLPGYKDSIEEQLVFLEELEKNNIFTNKFKLAEISDKTLKEAIYYTQSLKIPKKELILQKELGRRTAVPFRPPILNRPNMPEEVGIPETDYLNFLIGEIYLPKNPSKQQEAYHKFIDVFLTDWVNRKGFVNKGIQMQHTPAFDNAEFLTGLQIHIEKILKTKMLEKPNPGTINKRSGNSIRQQYLKDIYEGIAKRLELLKKEEFNRLTRANREKKGGRRTHKKIYAKRRKTRRN